MKEYRREYPLFALCGLNCGLCPRYQTQGDSKCPGCGGDGFSLKHPTCPVMTCNRKHDQVEYCFQCSSFPCQKYSSPSKVDSFITYRNVISDFEKASREGLDRYKAELNDKVKILEFLIDNYNDGRRKNFYCMAVNLLPLDDLKECIDDVQDKVGNNDAALKDRIKQLVSSFETRAQQKGIELKLRK